MDDSEDWLKSVWMELALVSTLWPPPVAPMTEVDAATGSMPAVVEGGARSATGSLALRRRQPK